MRLTLLGLALGLPAVIAVMQLLASAFTEMVDAELSLVLLLTLLVGRGAGAPEHVPAGATSDAGASDDRPACD